MSTLVNNCELIICFLWITNLSGTTGTQQVIDIFTNYPNTHEALQDYERLLESRVIDPGHNNEKPPDFKKVQKFENLNPVQSSETMLENKENSEDIISFLPRTITARGSSPVQFETTDRRTRNRKPQGRRRYNVYNYKTGTMLNNEDPWSTFSDYNFNNDHSQAGMNGDVLESEFGTFENPSNTQTQSSDSGYQTYQDYLDGSRPSQTTSTYSAISPDESSYLGTPQTTSEDAYHEDETYGTYGSGSYSGFNDLQAQPSIHQGYHHPHSSHNLLDLNSLVEVMSTRPSFLTGTLTGNRRNKTMFTTQHSQDLIEFDISGDGAGDDDNELESDFGEIVSTTIDRHKKRKGHVKRIRKPDNKQTGNKVGQSGSKPSKPHSPKVNKHHIGALNQLTGSTNKLKVTNLIRKYLTRMRNGTKGSGEENRKNRKQTKPKQNNVNDRTFVDKWFGSDKKVEFQTDYQANVTLPPSAQKFLLSGHSYTAPFEVIKNKTKHIANKFLSLFTIIQFSNFRCQATSTVSQYEGTCYLASECAERNGIAMGLCADGLGVCCVFRGTCGGVGTNNCTYFESPGYPNYFPQDGGVVIPTSTTRNPLTPDPRFPVISNTDAENLEQFENYQIDDYLEPESRQSETANSLACIFKVYKSSPNVQQMRIDFIDLELAGPTMGNCVTERLEITGMGLSMGIPPICGYNTGQHVLVDVSNLSGPLQLAVLANMVARKRYKLRICQYANGCSGLMNCLQSYTGVTGMIQSFNYDQAATLSRSMPGYFNNLNYAICIKREPGYCSITYTNIGPNGVVYPFELRNYEIDGSLTVPAGQAGAGVINCPQDYLVINGIRLCGDRLNDGSINDNFSTNVPVTDTSGGPIIIPVRTSPTSTSRGFKLFYTQNRCATNGGGAGTPDPRS